MASLEPLRSVRSSLIDAMARSVGMAQARPRHPLAPAAVRVERTRAHRGEESSEQTAVTLWFGEGPPLPTPSLSRSGWRTAAGLGMTVAGAAAMAVASTLAAEREERRRVAAARPVAGRPVAALPAPLHRPD